MREKFLKEHLKQKLQNIQFDEIRTYQWWYKAFIDLQSINPHRYRMKSSSHMEGMEIFHRLWDVKERKRIGPTLIYSNVTKEWRHVI